MEYFKKPKNIFQIELELLNQAENALLEIKKDTPTLINKKDYVSWVQKYNELYSQITKNYPSIAPSIDDKGVANPFKYVYYWLSKLVEYLNYEDEIRTLLEEYEALRLDLENDVLHWLVENEELGLKLFEFSWSCLDRESLIEGYLLFLKKQDIHVLECDFNVLQKFQTKFDDLYWGKLSHYATDAEINNNHSLKFYLEKRGIHF